ncbi:MAG: PAS domain S-box protein [Paludibacter sp.]
MKKEIIIETALNVLSLEDSILDFALIRECLIDAGYVLKILRVEKEAEFEDALKNNSYDIILADFNLPNYDAFKALELCKEICPDTPFICISGFIGEETAVELLKQGAEDYILKDRLARLPLAIKRTLNEVDEKKIKQQAVMKLHESEAKLNNLIMNLPGYVYRCKNDPNWTMIYISAGCEAITGYTSKEFTEQKVVFNNLVQADYKDFLWTQFQMDQSRQKVFEQEYPIITKNGETRWIWERGRMVFDDDKNPLYIEGFITDITERKQLENELANHHATLNAILESAIGPVFSLDTNYCYTTFNNVHAATMKALYGVDIELSKSILEYQTVSEDRESAKNNIDRALMGEHFVETSYYGDPGLKRLYYEIAHNPIYNSTSEIIGVSVFVQDITYRKQMELTILRNMKFTEKLLKSIPIPVFYKDVNALYLGCNDAFTEHSGLTEEYIKGKSMVDLWPGEQSELFHQMDLDTLNGENHLTYEAKIMDKENRTRDAIYFKNVFYDENGKAAGIVGAFIDITDRKRTEEERKYLLASVENVVDRIVVKDLNLKIVAANKSWLRGRGKNNISEVCGMTDAQAFGVSADTEPIRTYMVEEQNAQNLSQGEFTQSELPVKLFSGEDTICLVKRFPIFDENGMVFCTGTIATDITEHKMEEEKLRKSEEKFRTVANYTNDWEFWTDQNGDFIYCSPSCERITGYTDNDFLQNSDLLSDIIYSEDKAIYESHKKVEDLAEQGHKEIQFRIVCKDHKIKWIGHVSRPVYGDSGEFIGIRGSNRDITDRKEIEQQLIISTQKYKLISENISDGVFISRNGMLEYVNKAMNRIFGYDNLLLKDIPLIELVDDNFKDDVESFLKYTGSTNQSKNMELKCVKKEASTIYVDMIFNYVASEKVVYGVAHDVTESKLMQRKNIIKAIIQTEEKEKSYFSKELHDGLGPLLSTIKLYLQWSKRQNVDELREEIIQKAESILEEALITVTEISNKLSPHLLEDYGLTSAVQSFINKLKISTEIKLKFQSNMERRIDAAIEAALYRAIIECVTNTIKHAQANSIEIKIDDLGNQISLNYKDDGIGYNYDKIITEHKGLGLFNLKSRIQSIGGSLKMTSEVGQGVDYQIQVNT